jgi:hypothetical protein
LVAGSDADFIHCASLVVNSRLDENRKIVDHGDVLPPKSCFSGGMAGVADRVG